MKPSSFICPSCGSSNVRRSHRQSVNDTFRMVFGDYPLRCHDCEHRYWANILLLSKLRFAKCPHCLNFSLTTWDPKQYRVSWRRKLMMKLGAHRYRCNPCRFNFVSFRQAAPN